MKKFMGHRKVKAMTRNVLFLLNFSHFSPETGSLGTTESESLNRQFQCKSMKMYRAHSPQNLALTKIFHEFRKTSTSLVTFLDANYRNYAFLEFGS